jgi:hypothetical protein
MTPTRDEDANSENFSTVVPLRRRTEDAAAWTRRTPRQLPASDIWDPDDDQITELPKRSLWDPTAELPLRKRQPESPADADEASDAHRAGPAGRFTWGASPLRALALLAAGAAATASVALVLSGLSGATRPQAAPLQAATTTGSSPPAPAREEHTPAARTSTSRGHSATAAARTAPPRTTARRHVALKPPRHAATQRPSTFAVVVSHAATAPATAETARSDDADACVPGGLGC